METRSAATKLKKYIDSEGKAAAVLDDSLWVDGMIKVSFCLYAK